jgi:outer membrane protein assembly factor BamE (lipoprotein component of BamABCDE complex)
LEVKEDANQAAQATARKLADPGRCRSPIMKIIYKIAIAVGITVLIVGVLLGYCEWCVNGHPVSKNQMEKLYPGMNAKDVQNLLGSPWKEHKAKDGSFHWIYGSSMQWYYFTVEFSASSNIIKHYEDD